MFPRLLLYKHFGFVYRSMWRKICISANSLFSDLCIVRCEMFIIWKNVILKQELFNVSYMPEEFKRPEQK